MKYMRSGYRKVNTDIFCLNFSVIFIIVLMLLIFSLITDMLADIAIQMEKLFKIPFTLQG